MMININNLRKEGYTFEFDGENVIHRSITDPNDVIIENADEALSKLRKSMPSMDEICPLE